MVYILLGAGFEETEALAPCDLMRRAGLEVRLVTLTKDPLVTGSHRIRVQADCTLDEVDFENLELLMLPGGRGGVRSIRACAKALELTRRAWEEGRYVAAICAAPTILAELGIVGIGPATCYPGCESEMGKAKMENASTVTVDKLITGRAAGSSLDFGLELIAALKGREAAMEIAKQVVYV